MHKFNNSEAQDLNNRQSNDHIVYASLIPEEDPFRHSFSIHFHNSSENEYEWAETPYQPSHSILYAHRNDPHSLSSYNSLQSRQMKKEETVKIEYPEQVKLEHLPPLQIQYSQAAIEKRRQAIKGRSGQTRNLGTLFKRYTVNLLDLLLVCGDLQGEDRRVALQFKQKGVKLQQFEKLFQRKAIRKHAQAYFKTSLFMKSILGSQCEGINSKIMMVKYLGKFYELIFHKIDSWKLSSQ